MCVCVLHVLCGVWCVRVFACMYVCGSAHTCARMLSPPERQCLNSHFSPESWAWSRRACQPPCVRRETRAWTTVKEEEEVELWDDNDRVEPRSSRLLVLIPIAADISSCVEQGAKWAKAHIFNQEHTSLRQ